MPLWNAATFEIGSRSPVTSISTNFHRSRAGTRMRHSSREELPRGTRKYGCVPKPQGSEFFGSGFSRRKCDFSELPDSSYVAVILKSAGQDARRLGSSTEA